MKFEIETSMNAKKIYKIEAKDLEEALYCAKLYFHNDIFVSTMEDKDMDLINTRVMCTDNTDSIEK